MSACSLTERSLPSPDGVLSVLPTHIYLLFRHASVLPVLACTIVARDRKPVLLTAMPVCEASLEGLLKKCRDRLGKDDLPYASLVSFFS